ncbi:hypothetical protein K435DRAFT_301990 [Dendrothele bispora CBS 962.96]|uniref:C2H2-type domain-containing protein n=1 Tax=Dendrothele bispora (strain CBS 962.96) TaxID=1314807 RepID=A0A4S8LAZ3_DENBC|nr:hypothetical protein K435DRAFT_374806 [Dendrothele bispora CBS 962.96]THU88966.1 hypothetical protein K435DRAFT_301990 [Dendrothele bispora CBS 962.96]
MPVVRSKSVNACPECGREFERKHDLLRHSKMHDPNAKKHKCPEPNCSFSTLQKSNLITHMVIHTGTKPFACPSCDFATADPASLTRHRRRAHDYVPYRSAPRKKTATIAAARLSRQNTDPTSENSSPTTSTPAPASSTRRGRGRADRRSTNLQVTATTTTASQPTRVPSPVPSLSSSSESEPPTPPPSTPDTIESSLPASIYPSPSPAPAYVEHSTLDIACPPSGFFTGTVTGTVATEPQTQSYNYNYNTQAGTQASGFVGFTDTGVGSSDFPSSSESPYQWDLNQGLTSESPFSYSFSEYLRFVWGYRPY